MLEVGDPIDIWVVDRPLGRGGMGSVYRCHNRNAPRILAAVKVLDPSLSRRSDTQARFVREAEILFQLDHPNIVKVRNVRTDHEPPYLEMEFVEGQSLEDVLEQGAMRLDQAVSVMLQAARAVEYLHARGIRHRDIKPANFLVRKDRRLKLVDFGLAMEADVSRITQQGMAFGTVSYAPPEWITPDVLDPCSWDIYALGVVFWEILTGEVAFPVSGQGSGRQQVMQVIVGKQNHAPLDPGEAFPEPIRELVRHMTCSAASERLADISTAVKTLEALDGFQHLPGLPEITEEDSVVVSAPTPGVPPVRTSAPAETWTETAEAAPPPVAPRPRWPLLVGLGVLGLGGLGAAALAVVAGAAGWYQLGGGGRAVEVALVGLPTGLPVDAGIEGQTPSSAANHTLRYPSLSPATYEVRWAVGEGCSVAACAEGGCPAWCGTGSAPIVVELGTGKQVITVSAAGPQPRTVRIPLADLPREVPAEGTLGSVLAKRTAEGLGFPGILPGEHPLTLRIGSCPPEARGCGPEGCPPGCLDLSTRVVVPWDSGSLPSDALPTLNLEEFRVPQQPAPAPAPAPVKVPEPLRPDPPSPNPPSAAGPLITVGRFADWLATHPEYQPGNPKAAAPPYLEGWSGATPPSDRPRDAPMTHMSWHAARAYCGQLPDISLPFASASTGAIFEWRQQGGAPVALEDTGNVMPTNGVDSIMPYAVARCAR